MNAGEWGIIFLPIAYDAMTVICFWILLKRVYWLEYDNRNLLKRVHELERDHTDDMGD